MKQLYIMRHGQTEWNAEGRVQGRMDSALTEIGRAQAHLNGKLIKSLGGVQRLVASPSGRTTETAYLVNAYARAHLQWADELVERDFGDWSGLTIEEIEAKYPDAWAARDEDPYWHQPPAGENLHDLVLRVRGLLRELPNFGVDRLCLITHGIMSKAILKILLDLSEQDTIAVRHPNDLVYRLTFHPDRIETEHFTGGHTMSFSGLMRR